MQIAQSIWKSRMRFSHQRRVFSMRRSQAQFFVKYWIQRLFVENVTALIKMWRFLAGVSSPLVENKGEAEAGALYASRCDIFEKTFRCLRPKKG